MPGDSHETTWRTYQAAWSAIGDAERENLLASSVVEHCMYADPTSEAQGRTALIDRIRQSQVRFPGASFHTTKFVSHHGQALAQWTMFDGQGNVFVTGTSWARYADDGRLTHFTGFF